MDTRYNELFRYDLYSLNPTAWEMLIISGTELPDISSASNRKGD